MLFYDEAAYDVGVKTSNLIRLCNPQHARLINQLQWEVAHENLYVSPETDPSEVLQDAEQLAHLRHTEHVDVEDKVLPRDGKRKRVHLMLSGRAPVVRHDLPFVRTRLPVPQSLYGFQTLPVRHPEWAAFVQNAAHTLQDQQLTFAQYHAMMSQVPRTPRRILETKIDSRGVFDLLQAREPVPAGSPLNIAARSVI